MPQGHRFGTLFSLSAGVVEVTGSCVSYGALLETTTHLKHTTLCGVKKLQKGPFIDYDLGVSNLDVNGSIFLVPSHVNHVTFDLDL